MVVAEPFLFNLCELLCLKLLLISGNSFIFSYTIRAAICYSSRQETQFIDRGSEMEW